MNAPIAQRDDQPGTVLVVDDNESNRELLREVLAGEGHAVRLAADGRAALAELAAGGIDVVLLDVMMPGIDGIALCRRLRETPATAALPVLMITALQDRATRLAGIRAGASDFLSKPIDGTDVALRVRNAVRMAQHQERLARVVAQLRQQEELRESLTAMIVHDMRGPLMGVRCWLERFLAKTRDGGCEADRRAWIATAFTETGALVELVDSILDAARLEAARMPLDLREEDLAATAREALEQVRGEAEARGARLELGGAAAPAVFDRVLVRRAIANLVGNAVVHGRRGGHVRIEVAGGPGWVRLAVEDDGPGIAADLLPRLFEKFGPAAARQAGERSTGLGLPYCKLAIEAHGGRIGVDSAPGRGSRFWFTLPAVATPPGPG